MSVSLGGVDGLNPFFIRSFVPAERDHGSHTAEYEVLIPSSSGHLFRPMLYPSKVCCQTGSLNPFFIRSFVPAKKRTAAYHRRRVRLNPFFIRSFVPAGKGPRHSCTWDCLNPFFIRSFVPADAGWDNQLTRRES